MDHLNLIGQPNFIAGLPLHRPNATYIIESGGRYTSNDWGEEPASRGEEDYPDERSNQSSHTGRLPANAELHSNNGLHGISGP